MTITPKRGEQILLRALISTSTVDWSSQPAQDRGGQDLLLREAVIG
jgi:hypothetical protein